MATIVRLVHPKRTAVSATRQPAQQETGKARIKFESLPTVLSAMVSEVSSVGITIEADLPWLSVGTRVLANCPDGIEYTARVQSFDVDVTTAGAARLRIFAALSEPTGSTAKVAARPPAPSTRGRRLLEFGLLLAAAILCSSAMG
jgi:hypothetical protein